MGSFCAVVGIVMLVGAYQAIFDVIFQNVSLYNDNAQ